MLFSSQSYFQLAGILSLELVLAFERVAILVLGMIKYCAVILFTFYTTCTISWVCFCYEFLKFMCAFGGAIMIVCSCK